MFVSKLVIRFRIEDAVEVHKDPIGHAHHWTVLLGVLEEGTLSIADVLAIPRVGGGFWLGRVLGFERFRDELGTSIDAVTQARRPLGVAVWGVAPPQDSIVRADARVVGPSECREILAELQRLEPGVVTHCRDCQRVLSFA
jgi:hypothetical protein